MLPHLRSRVCLFAVGLVTRIPESRGSYSSVILATELWAQTSSTICTWGLRDRTLLCRSSGVGKRRAAQKPQTLTLSSKLELDLLAGPAPRGLHFILKMMNSTERIVENASCSVYAG